MGCNCGKPKPLGSKPNPGSGGLAGQTQQFGVLRNGQTQSFGSQLEAQAEAVRNGGIVTFG